MSLLTLEVELDQGRIFIAMAEGIDASVVTSDHRISQYPSAKVVW